MALLNIIAVLGEYIEATICEPFRAITDAFGSDEKRVAVAPGGVGYLISHLKKQRELCSPDRQITRRAQRYTVRRVVHLRLSDLPRHASGRGALA